MNAIIFLVLWGIFNAVVGLYSIWKRNVFLLYQPTHEVRGNAAIGIGFVWLFGGIMIVIGSLIKEASLAGLVMAVGGFPMAISIVMGHFIKKPIKQKRKSKNEQPIASDQKAN